MRHEELLYASSKPLKHKAAYPATAKLAETSSGLSFSCEGQAFVSGSNDAALLTLVTL